ncbi:hypothetical protein RVR_1258 [Actinacidiphila reveromycinica]|uniref:Uncharacterized protein n=1 Tax=Actinacidiphila reveromycinica TaxID=659352 RepID=A0A7U3UP04_9ACTN|nr:hypothetical protein [Streptomyces sp. SN-593]BBA96107.1 hypothetical protein RVR_1258 [Streptomyces sp. SN-593]
MSDIQLTAEERRSFGALVAQLWSDEELATRYRDEPVAVLAEYGISAQEALPVPPAPVEEISDESLGLLGAVGGLSTCGSASSFSCPGCTASTVGSGTCCGSQPTLPVS